MDDVPLILGYRISFCEVMTDVNQSDSIEIGKIEMEILTGVRIDLRASFGDRDRDGESLH